LLAVLALLLLIVNPAHLTRGALFAPLLAYLILIVAYHPRLQ
jgi:hypothetical protein